MSGTGPIHVHALIDSLGLGGAEMMLAEFATVREAAGVELTVGALREADGPASVRLRRAGVEPMFQPVTSLLRREDRRNVRRHVADVAPDVLHTHLGYADLLGGMAARSLGVPAVSTIHADWWGGSARDRLKSRLFVQGRRRCAVRIIAVSESARSNYIRIAREDPARVVTVHNGLAAPAQPGVGPSVREELGVPADALMVTMVSALRPGKGHELAVPAIRALLDRFPTLRLVIVGEGIARAEVERLAAGLGEAAALTGHRDDVMAVLDATDVLLHPSAMDAFPTSLLEAMAASVPVVASGVGGIVEIVEAGETGLLVDAPLRAEDFASALSRLLEDPGLRRRMGAAGRRRYERLFTAERWAERMRRTYAEVLEARQPERSGPAVWRRMGTAG